MVDRIRRGYPVKIPAFKMSDGSAEDWTGKPPKADDQDLPIAHMYERLAANKQGFSLVQFVGKNAPRQGRPLRVPCVAVNVSQELVDAMTPEEIERADALGVIFITISFQPWNPDVPIERFLAYGVPTFDWVTGQEEPLPAESYLGGRLFVLYNGFEGGPYWVFTDSEDVEETAQPADDATCAEFGEDLIAGEGTLQYVAYSRFIDFAQVGDLINQDAAFIQEHAERFDKYRIWIKRYDREEEPTYNVGVVCHETNEDLDTVFTTDETAPADLSTEDAILQGYSDLAQGEIGSAIVTVSDDEPTIDQILTFFESE